MKKKPITLAKKKAWSAFSQYVRLKNASKDGLVKCTTCSKVKHWKEMQAGHLLDGRSNSILFDEETVFVQCYECNCMLHGHKEFLIPWFIDTFGRDKYDQALVRKMTPVKYAISDYEEIFKKYNSLIERIIDGQT